MTDEKKAVVSAFVGRPPERTSARRYVSLRRDRALLRMWKAAPEAIKYIAAVAAGREKYDDGRFRAAREILLRTMPTITAQTVASTSISADLTVSEAGTVGAALAAEAQHRETVRERLRVLCERTDLGQVQPVEAEFVTVRDVAPDPNANLSPEEIAALSQDLPKPIKQKLRALRTVPGAQPEAPPASTENE